MYAIIQTGGKQYRVEPEMVLEVERLAAEPGAEVSLGAALALHDGSQIRVGSPLLTGSEVKASVLEHGRGEKVSIFKMRRRKHYQKHQGHRQSFTKIKITQIAG